MAWTNTTSFHTGPLERSSGKLRYTAFDNQEGHCEEDERTEQNSEADIDEKMKMGAKTKRKYEQRVQKVVT